MNTAEKVVLRKKKKDYPGTQHSSTSSINLSSSSKITQISLKAGLDLRTDLNPREGREFSPKVRQQGIKSHYLKSYNSMQVLPSTQKKILPVIAQQDPVGKLENLCKRKSIKPNRKNRKCKKCNSFYSGQNVQIDLEASINYEKIETPKRRSLSEVNPPYSETIPISRIKEEKLTQLVKPEFSKCLPLDIYDPIIDPMSPGNLLDHYKANNPVASAFSKWFFGNGTYEWRSCTVKSFDSEKEQFLIFWSNGVKKYVSRINLRFFDEDEERFEERIAEARMHREEAEVSIRYNQFIACNIFKPPEFSSKLMISILKYTQGKCGSDLSKLRNLDSYSTLSASTRHNPKRFLWPNDITHVSDERSIKHANGFKSHKEYLKVHIDKFTDFKLASYPAMQLSIPATRIFELICEVQENWILTSKHLDFEAKNREIVQKSIFSIKLRPTAYPFRDSLSIKPPVIEPGRFLHLFNSFKQRSFFSNAATLKIMKQVNYQISILSEATLFPLTDSESKPIDRIIDCYTMHSDMFIIDIRNAIFDSQCAVEEVIEEQDRKRIQRNELKLKERIHSKQIIILEDTLPQAVVNSMRKLIRLCNMKIEDKVRERVNISLTALKNRFGATYEIFNKRIKSLRSLKIDDLDLIKGIGSRFLQINLVIDLENKTIQTNPSRTIIKENILKFIEGIFAKLSSLQCISSIKTGPTMNNSCLSILEICHDEYLSTMKDLEANLEYQFKLLELFISKLEPYFFCISLNAGAISYEFALKSADEVENEIFRLKRNMLEISKLLAPSNDSIGIWVINGRGVIKSLSSNMDKVFQSLFKLLIEDSYVKINQIKLQYNEVLSEIDHPPQDIEELDTMRTFINSNYKTKVNFIEESLSYISNCLENLEGYHYHVNFDLYSKYWACLAYTTALESEKDHALKIIEQLLVVFTTQLAEDKNKLFATIHILDQKLNLLKQENDIDNQENISFEYMLFQSEHKEASELARKVNTRENLIKEPLSDFKLLEEIKREFTPYHKVWGYIKEFYQKYPQWMNGPIGTLNREGITDDVKNWISDVGKMEKNNFMNNPMVLKLTSIFMNKVNDFKPYIPVIRVFTNPGMRERHWVDIQHAAKIVFSLNKGTSLKTLISNNILEHLDILESTAELANKELALEAAKRKMENAWNGVSFEVIPYKTSYIIVNTEPVWDMINEQQMKSAAMLLSPFIGFIINEMNSWYSNLSKIQEVLEHWERFQRNWQYLQPIFASQDIARQLPEASIKFRTINIQWEGIMHGVNINPNVLEACLGQPKALEVFKYGNEGLESILKNLNEYLQSKRKAFPRFYFLSIEELVAILSNSQDLVSMQKYIVKCFEAINLVLIEDKKIVGMISPEGESVYFVNSIELYIGDEIKSIEIWMLDIEKEMFACMKALMINCIRDWTSDLMRWVSRWPSQLIHAGLMMLWTSEAEKSITEGSLQEYFQVQNDKLQVLVETVRGKLPALERSTFSTMIVLEVHNKDIIEGLLAKKVQNISDFAWFNNMRYYLAGAVMEINMLDCRQVYGYEYLGNSPRLVITALTDRCYMTLMGAMNMSLGGAPEGPAGTGKTETVKDLSKGLGKKCIVFNCSDRLNHLYMYKFFTGLCYCGAWACFDEFNRIELEVLSVIAEQVLCIQSAVQRKDDVFEFDSGEVRLNLNVAIFITMNPDYVGRSKLPDNLKALFRPVAMMTPDYSMIAEIYLYSYGFKEARTLSRKITNSLKLASEQLSNQTHYDYGMRAVSTIIKAAGWFKQTNSEESEEKIVLQAIRSTNLPKFLSFDTPIFEGIILDLFPEACNAESEESKLSEAILSALFENCLVETPKFLQKALEIFATARLRHGLMVVGDSFSGKTSTLKILAKALSCDNKVETVFINPKSMTLEQLYGAPDPVSQDWKDGILALAIRHFSDAPSEGYKWVVLDGPVDAVWIESMNTVMDDNRKLCLNSGEIIKLTTAVRLIFEVDDLSQASPATVSRCGMIYLDAESTLGPLPIVESWIAYPPRQLFSISMKETLKKLFSQLFLPCLEYWKTDIRPFIPIKVSTSVITMNMIKLFQSLILKKGKSRKQHDSIAREEPILLSTSKKNSFTDASPVKLLPGSLSLIVSSDTIMQEAISILKPDDFNREIERFTNLFIFAMQWSLGAVCDKDRRALLTQKILEKSRSLVELPEDLYDYFYNEQGKRWTRWTTQLSTPENQLNTGTILVPTISLVQYNYILTELITRKENILVSGDTGTGKTMQLEYTIKQLDKTFNFSSTMFSAKTTAQDTQSFIESVLGRRRKGVYGPEYGKFRILLVDDVGMPAKEEFGSQPAIESLRSIIERMQYYDHNSLESRFLEDVQYICVMGSTGSGRNSISSRFISKNFLLIFNPYDQESLFLILNTHLTLGLSSHPSAVNNSATSLVQAIVSTYNSVVTRLPPTPTKPHYTYNLRDLSNLIKGIYMSPPAKLNNIASLHLLWVNESTRVFSDKLVDEQDKNIFTEILKEIAEKSLMISWDEAMKNKPCFSNCLDDKIYQECLDNKRLKQCLESYLDSYNNDCPVKMNLLMFDYAIDHIIRISRVIAWNCGNLLLIGMGGSGRMSLTRLCAYFHKMEIFQVKLTKSYGLTEWGEDLKVVMKLVGQEDKKMVFILRDSEIIMEEFLESINSILNSGYAANLLCDDEIKGIQDYLKINKNYSLLDNQKLWDVFISNVKKNLHIVLCMIPTGDLLRRRIRNFPSLVNCCTIDWFSEWPEQALAEVAKFFIKSESIADSEEILEKVMQMCVNFHVSMQNLSESYILEYKRYNYVTPTHYLLLLRNLKGLYIHKQQTTTKQIRKYSVGVEQLDRTHQVVQELKEELIALKPILEQKTVLAEETVKQIQQENEEADKARMQVAEEQHACELEARYAEKIRNECEEALAKTLPELEDAIRSLDTIKKEDIDLVKSMHKPPVGVRLTLEALAIINRQKPVRITDPENPDLKIPNFYKSGKKMLYIPKFINMLQLFDRDSLDDEVMSRLTPYINMKKFNPEGVRYASSAAEGMCRWVRAMHKFYHVNKEIKPKRESLKEAERHVVEMTRLLRIKQTELKEIEDYIEKLKIKLDMQVSEKNALISEIQLVEIKMIRAEQLISQLSGEKETWRSRVSQYMADIVNILGDVLLSAAVVSYLGAFILTYREQVLYKNWVPHLDSLGEINHSDNFTLSKIVGEPALIQKWTVSGLPTDKISVENALIIQYSLNWPLIIDPQGQASKWLNKMFHQSKTPYSKKKLDSSDFMSVLENTMFMGSILIIEDLKESIDPVLDSLLLKQWFIQDSTIVIKIGDSIKQYDPTFKLYMLSNYANPHFSPEICTKVTLLNFSITEDGLAEQLLDIVCRKEIPKDTQERDQLILQSVEFTKNLQAFEDKILDMLLHGGSTILDNEELIDSLTRSKELSNEVEKKLATAKQAEQRIFSVQINYMPACKQSAVLYYCVSDLANIELMYQFSMKWFVYTFKKAISEAEKSKDTSERVKHIIVKFRELIYIGTYLALKESDKVVFSFLVSTRLQMFEKEIQPWQWKFFLTGLCGIAEPRDNLIHFLSDKAWRETLQLDSQIPGLCDHIVENQEQWKEFLITNKTFTNLPSFEEFSQIIPDPLNKQPIINRLLIIRAMKPESIEFAMKCYIKSILGEKYLQPIIFSPATIYKETSPFKPLIFILTPGTDPQSMVKRHTTEIAVNLVSVSLGKGQGARAEQLIEECAMSGKWLLLQNCHLALSWLPRLELLLEQLSSETKRQTVHKSFRLTLTAAPNDSFPVSILRKSVKAVSQLPSGLIPSLLGIYSGISESKEEVNFYNASSKPNSWRKLFFCLNFFHCAIRERILYGPIGWNVKYEFSESDLRISSRQLMEMVNQFEVPPFDALCYLTAECNYGGKVTDDWDRRSLIVTLQSFYRPEMLGETNSIVPVPGYVFPHTTDLFGITNAIKGFPQVQTPELFGLHPNANISRSRREGYEACSRLLALQPKAVVTSYEEQKFSIIFLCDMIRSKLSRTFDIEEALAKYPVSYYESMNTVLMQELNRYNTLINIIASSLSVLKKIYEGTMLITSEYEVLGQSMLKNKVPEAWSKYSYLSNKTLLSYIEDLEKRIDFLDTWIKKGRPQVFWMSGFFFTQAFLTATLQENARKKKLPIDTLAFTFQVMNGMPTTRPEEGEYVSGLYLEGARWNGESLVESINRELYFNFPVVRFM